MLLRNGINTLRSIWWRINDFEIIDKRNLSPLWEQQALRQVFNKFDVDCVFDIGANEGQYATMLRRKCSYNGLIVSFEPIPEVAEKLRSLSYNDPDWIVKEIAIAEKKGTAEFNVMKHSQFSSLSEPRHDETQLFEQKNLVDRKLTVETDSLAVVFDELQKKYKFKRPFLKLDTQGYDVQIVEHSQDKISHFVGFQSELSVKKIYAHSIDYCDAIRFYESLGFTLSSFVPNNPGHFPYLIETDCIMLNRRFL